MTYLDRPAPPKGPPWAHNSLGASVHNALAGWWRLPLPQRDPAAAGRLLTGGWITEGYADQAQSDAWLHWAREIVERYTAGLDPAAEPAGVERTVATRTKVIALSGRIDRLDRRPAGPGLATELAVVDYKTGRRPLTTDDARSSLALALYALAAGRVLRQPCYRVELHQVTRGTVIGWTHTPESLQRHLSRAEDIAEECAAADASYRAGPAGLDRVFPPQTGPACGWCDFRAHCPEGQAAADQRRPWDGLADEFTRPDPARPAPPVPGPPVPGPSVPAPARPDDAADAPPAGS